MSRTCGKPRFPGLIRVRELNQAVTTMPEMETGNFAPPRWVIFPPDAIRVVNWNIDRGLQLQRVIDFLGSAKADLILLQETDVNARRTHHINVGKEIAQKLRMNYVFGREFQELAQGSRASPAYHGQTTLSSWPLSNSRIIRFQRQSSFWRPHWFLPQIDPFQERFGGRLALVCQVNIGGKRIVTYNLHLESKGDKALRCSQLDETIDDAVRYGEGTPILLAGDFNLDVSELPASTLTRALFQDGFANRHVPTTPGSFLQNGRVIDWIFSRGPIQSSHAQVHRSVSASDHYPLSINLAFT